MRNRIIEAALAIAEEHSAPLSARTIAGRAGCSPGHLYNLFRNLDELVLHAETAVLERLEARLRLVPVEQPAGDYLVTFASAYLAFAQEQPGLWALIARHDLQVGRSTPDGYAQKLANLVAMIDQALMPLSGAARQDASMLQATTLWAAIHGTVTLATARKTSTIDGNNVEAVLAMLVTTFLAGLGLDTVAAMVRRAEPTQN